MNIKTIEKLNDEIVKLNRAREQAVARREVLTETLQKDISDYSKRYGVQFEGTLSEIKDKVDRELRKLQEGIENDYREKLAAVEFIKSGEYKKAGTALKVDEPLWTQGGVEDSDAGEDAGEDSRESGTEWESFATTEEDDSQDTDWESFAFFGEDEDSEPEDSDESGSEEAEESVGKAGESVPEGFTSIDSIVKEDPEEEEEFDFSNLLSGTSFDLD